MFRIYLNLLWVITVGLSFSSFAQDGKLIWLNPIPQGNMQWGSAYLPDKGRLLITTEIGKYHFTDDEGLTWQIKDFPNDILYDHVKFTANDIGFVLGRQGNLLKTQNAGSTWELQILNEEYNLYDIIEKDDVYYLCGGKELYEPFGNGFQVNPWGILYKSIDQGITWSEVHESQGEQFRSFALLQDNTIILNSENKLLISTNGGLNFTPIGFPNPALNYITHAVFTTEQSGYMLLGSVLLFTENSGLNWHELNVMLSPYKIHLSGDSIYVATEQSVYVSNRTDFSWHERKITTGQNISNYRFWKTHFSENGVIITVSQYYGATFISKDFGNTWKRMFRDLLSDNEQFGDYQIQSIRSIFTSPFVGYASIISQKAVSNERVYRTTDGGCGWVDMPNFPGRPTFFFNDTIGFAGNLFKTLDGGNSWQACGISPNNVSAITSIGFFDDQNGIGASPEGEIFTTNNGGMNWNRISGYWFDSNTQPRIIIHSPTHASIVTGRERIATTQDKGQSWRTYMPNSSYTIEDILFFDGSSGLAVGGNYSVDGVILRTTNGGLSWTTDQTFPFWLNYIHFESSLIGTIYGDVGYTLKTVDGGQTWNQEPRTTDHPLRTKQFENGVTYLSGISHSSSHTLLKKPIKPTAIAFAQSEVCSGVPFYPENESVNARIFTWKIDGAISAQIDKPELTIHEPGIHSIELVANSCGDTDTTSFTISVLPLPSPDLLLNGLSLTKDTLLCNVQSALITLDETFQTYLWSNDTSDPCLNLSETTTLWAEVTDINGCLNRSDTVTIVFQVDPIVDFEFFVENGLVTFVNKSTSANNYFWNFGDEETSSETNPIKEYTANGQYVVSLTAENECAEGTLNKNIDILIVGLESPLNQQIEFYPNPTNGIINFNYEEPPHFIEILNSIGQIVYSGINIQHKKSIDLSNYLPPGVYFLRVEHTNSKVEVWRLVIL